MPDPGLMTAKMRAYMEALSPAARAMMLRAMRNAQERGDSNGTTQAIIKAVAAIEAGADRSGAAALPAKTVSNLPWGEQVRLAFFAPVQTFVCDLTFPQKIVGRIQRRSIDAIWTVMFRDIAADAFTQALETAGPDASVAARKLRRDVTPKVAALLQSGDINSKQIRRLAGQLGSEVALQDLTEVIYIFQKEGAFLNFAGQLPRTISAFDLTDTGPVVDLSKKAIDSQQVDPAFVAAILIQRCSSVASVAILAMTLAGSNDPRVVQASPYGRIVDTVIAETEILVHRFEDHLKDRANRLKTLDDLGDYHELVRQLELTLQPNQVQAWHRRLGAARKYMSDLIGKDIEPLPGLIRRALRVESTAGAFGGQFDAETAEDAEFGIRLLLEARNALDSLALNDLVAKLRRPVEQTIEVVTAKLMTDFKSGQVADRGDLLKAIDAAIRMSAIVFGEDYASVMRKSRDNALNKPQKSANG